MGESTPALGAVFFFFLTLTIASVGGFKSIVQYGPMLLKGV